MLTPRECGNQCRVAFGEFFKPQWGAYKRTGRKIHFESKAVFALYSSFSTQQSRWWYSVQKREWEDWQNQSLVFLMKESNEVYYVLLNPKEAETLLGRCEPETDYQYKYITIQRPTSGGSIYCVEWRELSLASTLCSLQVPWGDVQT